MERRNVKKALVLTYHVHNSKRVGGFHYFINFIKDAGYDIDWVTIPVSLSWLFKHSDRENAKNFLTLVRGMKYTNGDVLVHHFTSPLWIPARVAQKLHLDIGRHYWPSWNKMKKKLRKHYDLILFEGVACQYAQALRTAYPKARIIYRPSDILATFSDVNNPEEMEKCAIDYSDYTACVDENQMNYYEKFIDGIDHIGIVRNPLVSRDDIQYLRQLRIEKNSHEKIVIYIGVSFCDFEMIEYAASNNPSCKFIIIGPFSKKSSNNIIYTGSLNKKDFEEYLKRADVAIAPTTTTPYKEEHNIRYGYTGKILSYMKFLLPIVATCSENYLNIEGFYCVDTKEEFSEQIRRCLQYSATDRMKLKDQYLDLMEEFLEEKSKRSFWNCILNSN